MFRTILPVLGLAACLGACLDPSRSNEGGSKQPIAGKSPFVLDDDGVPVTEIEPEILKDLHAQMLLQGETEDARMLEAAYDFETGFSRLPAPAGKP